MESRPVVKQNKGNGGKGKEKEEITFEKAIWDPVANQIYVSICVDLVLSGNKPNSSLSKYGFAKLIKQFNERTGRNYVRKQFKNHWDALKKDWSLWRKLTHGETGLGMNHDLGTIDASDEWWDKKLKIVLEAAKFRTAPLAHWQELQTIFCDSVATGEHAWTPNSGVLPPHMVDLETDDENVQPLEDIEIDADASTVAANARKRVSTSGPRKAKTKRVSAANKLTEAIDIIVEVITNDSVTSAPTYVEPPFFIRECLACLDEMLSVGDPLYAFTLHMFHRPVSREIFLQLTIEARLIWLKAEQALSKK